MQVAVRDQCRDTKTSYRHEPGTNVPEGVKSMHETVQEKEFQDSDKEGSKSNDMTPKEPDAARSETEPDLETSKVGAGG
jgi:hypothetical protein